MQCPDCEAKDRITIAGKIFCANCGTLWSGVESKASTAEANSKSNAVKVAKNGSLDSAKNNDVIATTQNLAESKPLTQSASDNSVVSHNNTVKPIDTKEAKIVAPVLPSSPLEVSSSAKASADDSSDVQAKEEKKPFSIRRNKPSIADQPLSTAPGIAKFHSTTLANSVLPQTSSTDSNLSVSNNSSASASFSLPIPPISTVSSSAPQPLSKTSDDQDLEISSLDKKAQGVLTDEQFKNLASISTPAQSQTPSLSSASSNQSPALTPQTNQPLPTNTPSQTVKSTPAPAPLAATTPLPQPLNTPIQKPANPSLPQVSNKPALSVAPTPSVAQNPVSAPNAKPITPTLTQQPSIAPNQTSQTIAKPISTRITQQSSMAPSQTSQAVISPSVPAAQAIKPQPLPNVNPPTVLPTVNTESSVTPQTQANINPPKAAVPIGSVQHRIERTNNVSPLQIPKPPTNLGGLSASNPTVSSYQTPKPIISQAQPVPLPQPQRLQDVISSSAPNQAPVTKTASGVGLDGVTMSKEQALKLALSSAEPQGANNQNQVAVGTNYKPLKAAVAVIILLVIGGYIWQINYPNLALKVAGSRAGISANIPTYLPNGWQVSRQINSEPGKLVFSASSNTGQTITITQAKTDWDSAAVLENYVLDETNQYTALSSNGLTIYLFNKKATWVNRGSWFVLDGQNSDLDQDQIIKIATNS